MSQPFVHQLLLPQKSRIAVQLLVTSLLIFAGIYAYCTVPKIFNSMDRGPQGMKEPPLWFTIAVFVLSIIPAMFVFFLLKREFHFVGDNELEDAPKYKV